MYITIDNTEKKLGIKQFLIQSIYIYPFWFFLIVNSDYIEKNNLQEFEVYITIGVFLIFSILNWFLSKKKIASYFLLFHVAMIAWCVSSSQISYGEATVLYTGFLPVIIFAQFVTWVPFLLKFLYQNRHNLNKLPFD